MLAAGWPLALRWIPEWACWLSASTRSGLFIRSPFAMHPASMRVSERPHSPLWRPRCQSSIAMPPSERVDSIQSGVAPRLHPGSGLLPEGTEGTGLPLTSDHTRTNTQQVLCRRRVSSRCRCGWTHTHTHTDIIISEIRCLPQGRYVAVSHPGPRNDMSVMRDVARTQSAANRRIWDGSCASELCPLETQREGLSSSLFVTPFLVSFRGDILPLRSMYLLYCTIPCKTCLMSGASSHFRPKMGMEPYFSHSLSTQGKDYEFPIKSRRDKPRPKRDD